MNPRRADELSPAVVGKGPLLQRDYWGVIDGCRASPEALMRAIARHFECFSPEALASFHRHGAEDRALTIGDELDVKIAATGTFRVKVIHADAQSLTLGTVQGHPEAGRITFGAYRNKRGDVVFHIRSRARSRSRFHYLGFIGAGEPMQTTVWTDFVNRVGVFAGRGIVGRVFAKTFECVDESETVATHAPTFTARGN